MGLGSELAGRGPAPKPAGQRRNRTAPARGEWVDLEPLEKPVLPELPELVDAEWSSRTRAAWEAWRSDPVTGVYSPVDVAACLELAFVMEDFVRGGGEKSSEVRLRMDGLGLTPKGKRDLRWRAPAEQKAAETAKPQMAEVRRLRAVDPLTAAG